MMRSSKALHLPLIFALALLAFVVLVVPVYAQDVLPADPVPVNEPAPVEEPPAPEVAPVDAPVVAADTTTSEVVSAADFVDPWFMVGTTRYSFMPVGGCTGITGYCEENAQAIQAAVDYIKDHGTIPSDGFIHVEAGSLNNQRISIDGSLPYENSIKGIVGVVETLDNSPTTILGVDDTVGSYIEVTHKTNGFTLSGLFFKGYSEFSPNTGLIWTSTNTGTITLKNLSVMNGSLSATGIVVTDQNGPVSFTNVTSSENTGSGAYIDNTTNTTGTAGVIITNSSFDRNSGSGTYLSTGLTIKSNGPVLLANITANNNLGLASPALYIIQGKSVTINRGVFIGNHTTGLCVNTTGAILLTNIDASKNQDAVTNPLGADLGNFSATTAMGVTITNGTFWDNSTIGLKIETKGAVLLNNVASWDNSSGVVILNTPGIASNVTITNLTSTDAAMQPGFNNNSDRGISIRTNGFVTLTNVNAIGNQLEGIYIPLEGNKGVKLTNCRADENTSDSGAAGIFINSVGPITITGGHANNNVSNGGLYAHNEGAPDLTPKTVTISNFSADGNNGYGIEVSSKGAIKLTSVTANHTVGSAYRAINLTNSFPNMTAGITLSKVEANDNINEGIEIFSHGVISWTYISARDNGGLGTNITLTPAFFVCPTTTITNGNFSSNGGAGLTITGCGGSITLKDITADNNTSGGGTYITNLFGKVTLLASATGGNSFSHNLGGANGLRIDTTGAVALNKLIASGNTTGIGVSLAHWDGVSNVGVGPVTIIGGTFSDQTLGLIVLSNGIIKVDNVVAENNNETGLEFNNTFNTTGSMSITLSRLSANYNLKGVLANSYGQITVSTVNARYNQEEGVRLNNNYGTLLAPKGITITSSYGISNICNNGISGQFSGLVVRSRGSISITGVVASYNTERGIDLDESTATNALGKITLANITASNNVGQSGIYANTGLALTATSLVCNYNGYGFDWDGLSIAGHGNGAAVTISNSTFLANSAFGIWADNVTGLFKLYNVTAVGNGNGNIVQQ